MLYFFLLTSCSKNYIQLGLNLKYNSVSQKDQNSFTSAQGLKTDVEYLEKGTYYLSKTFTSDKNSDYISYFFCPRGILFKNPASIISSFNWTLSGTEDSVQVYVFEKLQRNTILFREPGFQHAIALNTPSIDTLTVEEFLNKNISLLFRVKNE